MKLGVLQGYLLDDLDNQVAKAFAAVLTVLSQSGAIIQDVSCPAIGTIPELNRDGGIPAFESCAIHKELLATRRSEYDPRVLSRILRGAKISAEAHSELISGRRNVISGASECFRGFDAILVPTVPRIAPTIQEATLDDASYAAANFAMLRNPSVVNFLNGCALSVPCHQPGDAPVGLMIFGMEDQDAKILSVGLSIQKALDAPGLRHPASLAIQ
jgi:aspartyl-tRNA(Asn)/glutamyl-tRNA(Gln) amidotransferase subunit A